MTETSWTDPGAWPVAPGVHRIPLPLPSDGLRAVNVYALEEPDGIALVDSGWAVSGTAPALDAALRSLGYCSADVRRVLVTHIHRDHYTQAVLLRRGHGARLTLGVGERASLAALNDPAMAQFQVSHLVQCGAGRLSQWWQESFGAPGRDLSYWEAPDDWLTGDGRVELGGRVVHAFETPGHTRGHLVFADMAAGLLFAGDHVLPTITPSIGYEPVPTPLPLADYLASLAKVRALPDLVLLPAHGQAGGSVHARIDELLEHHDNRLARCRDAAEGRSVTAHEVALALPWTRRERPFSSLDDYSAALAVLETRAHLEVLVARGELLRGSTGNVVRYAAAQAWLRGSPSRSPAIPAHRAGAKASPQTGTRADRAPHRPRSAR
jgi:glyoxylase-like metal-dependent hydrolase (beta-lactamase superfamily II)